MTEEQIEDLIIEHLGQITNPPAVEELRDILNQKTTPHGWEVKSIKNSGRGFCFNVKPVDKYSQNSIGTSPHTSLGPPPNTTGGIKCRKCGNYNPYLDTPNQPDGTHICYSCRS
jgi:hypothetical protein